jgi:hypothetical protein
MDRFVPRDDRLGLMDSPLSCHGELSAAIHTRHGERSVAIHTRHGERSVAIHFSFWFVTLQPAMTSN